MNRLDHRLSYTIDSNNWKTIEIDIPQFPLSTTSCWIHAGSKYDPIDKQGLSHFFEHLLCVRTKKFPDRLKRLIEIEKRGMFYNATTTKEIQRYFFINTPKKSEEAKDFIIDGIFNSIFDENDILEEKNIILNEQNTNFNDPSSYIWRLADKGIWNENPLSQDIYGSAESISQIQKKDMEKFYKNFFTPERILFLNINSNNVTKKSSSKFVEKKFIKELSNKKKKNAKILPIIFEKRNIDILHLALTFITTDINNIDDILILDCIRSYLANGWISKLIQALRVINHLTYWVTGSTNYYEQTGYLRFYLSIQPSDTQKVLSLFESEIIYLKESLISHQSLQDHLNKYKSDLLRNSLDIDWLLWWYGWSTCLTKQEPISLQSYIEKLKEITPEDVQRVAQRYLNVQNFSIAIIGKSNTISTIPTFL